MKFGAAFFGWLAAVGLTVLLAALVAGTGSAIGFSTDTTVQDAANNAKDVGIAGPVALLVILLIAYFAGGYVAGRMARFDGAKQGIAVWLWAVLVAVVIAVLGLIAGDRFDVLSQLDALPSIPVSTDDATTTGIIALVTVAAVTLIGAISEASPACGTTARSTTPTTPWTNPATCAYIGASPRWQAGLVAPRDAPDPPAVVCNPARCCGGDPLRPFHLYAGRT